VEQSTRPMKKLKGHDLTKGQDTVVEEATHEEEEEESDEEEESEESEEEESEEECWIMERAHRVFQLLSHII
jgi:hypothetical protein